MPDSIRPLRLPEAAKERLRFLFMAKHALWGGSMHPEDGNHAIYHHEVRTTLESLGINMMVANSYDVLLTKPDVDFVFPLLNRGGFLNSEMLIPLLCNKHGIRYVGGSPIIRGLGDDKHLSKLVSVNAGVPTAPWFCYRKGAPVRESDCPEADRWVIKPNASSASWGISDAFDWNGVANAVAGIHQQGHDAIVEPYLEGMDVQAAFISIDGPVALPMLIYEREDPTRLWTYYEKRDLIANTEKASLQRFTDPEHAPKVAELAQKIANAFEPFDYGRLEFRLDRKTGDINFIEINLNCNLWSEKVVAKSAAAAGLSHAELLETILADSLARQGLIDRRDIILG
ncbi:phosphoribosylglycinamide synthetase [Blastomonas sp.]|uniref:phosphoribosylglycinamide synthetase n=1 Tax=Blastomonas sp. TaxID=1909299 RepID=UPI002618AD9A|nr:phosphoribosylglycinamide synthetase [Blastomonas sp.]MDM7958098.1 phosphoribosylglycinamide synthetase [Blastomonas sp.]